MKNIILCGFMGSGKTTAGKLLAELMHAEFIDTDEYIVSLCGCEISRIFSDKGEDYFRRLETEACRELSKKSGLILSLGGGTLLAQENVDLLKKSGVIFLLDVPANVIYNRIKDDSTRPLLQNPDKKSALNELYNKRLPSYKKAADFIIDDNCHPSEVVKKIFKKIKTLDF